MILKSNLREYLPTAWNAEHKIRLIPNYGPLKPLILRGKRYPASHKIYTNSRFV